jgi:hypothetical protein
VMAIAAERTNIDHDATENHGDGLLAGA